MEIPRDEPGFTKDRVVALTSLVQPMLKSELIEHVGDLRPATLGTIMSRVARILKLTPGDLGV